MIKNRFQAVLLLSGIFLVSSAVFFGVGMGVKYLAAGKPAEPKGEDVSFPNPVQEEPVGKPEPPTEPTIVSTFEIKSVSVAFDKKSRRYTVSPVLSEDVGTGLLLELYKSSSCEGTPVAVSTAKNPGKVFSVKQSQSSYWLVAKDTASERQTAAFEVKGCVPKKLTAKEIENAIINNSLGSLGKAIPSNAINIQDQNGKRYNYLVNLSQMIKTGQWKTVHVTDVYYDSEQNEYRVNGFRFRYEE